MITMTTTTRVEGLSAHQITSFLLDPSDERYQRWWPGTHLAFHNVVRRSGDVGSVIFMDELVGKRRIQMRAVVVEAIPGRRLVWQMKKGVRLPATVALELEDRAGGVDVSHTIQAGFAGLGRAFDPALRLYFSSTFRDEVDRHVKTEFAKLGELLAETTVIAKVT